MGADKLHTYITMMGGPLRMCGVCVVIWVMVVARGEAQAGGDNLKAPVYTTEPFLTTDGIKRWLVNGPTSTSIDTRTRMVSRTTAKGLESIGGRVQTDENGKKWLFKGHSYDLDDDSRTRMRGGFMNGHTGGVRGVWGGQATREGPHHSIPAHQDQDDPGQEQVSGAGGGRGPGEAPDTHLNGPAEKKSSAGPEMASSVDWSRDSGQWTYQDGEWMVVRLPNPAYPSLPTPPPPAAALVVATNKKVEVERNVADLANVTLHYRFFLSDSQDPDTEPQLKVYHVVNDTRTLLQTDREHGEWYSRTLDVPQADKILFEGWLRGAADVIALSDVDTGGVVTHTRDEPLDVGDELTLTTGQVNTTEILTSTPTPEGNQTQDSAASETVPTPTDSEPQDNTTLLNVPPTGTQVDLSLNSTTNTTEGEVAVSNVTETPTNTSEVEASSNDPDNTTQATQQINGSLDIVALNSSTTADNNTTLEGSESDFSNSTTTDEESETDEEVSTTIIVTSDEASTSQPVLSNQEDKNNSSIPDVTTDAIQTNTSVTLPATTTTTTTLINTAMPGNNNTNLTRTNLTNGTIDISQYEIGGDNELTSEMTPEAPNTNGTSGNITSPSGVTISLESSPVPSAVSNSTEGVTAVPVTNASWQVFQVFLALCVLGLLALGFLYWKKKRRQDDEIPVFTRHTDYHNPTFSMEDAANFMSRTGRNTYKTIE